MDSENHLKDRILYIPQMSYEGAACMAAAFRSIGINARPSPDGNEKTYELARKYLSGDECLPEAITLGNFLKVTEMPDYDPDKVAFMMPTSNGPCRFGHYLPLARKVFRDRQEPVLFLSPSSKNGYKDIGRDANELVRTGWRAVVASDILRKMLHKTRPLEESVGDTDRVFHKALEQVCSAIELQNISHEQRLKSMINALTEARDQFRKIPLDRSKKPLLIGMVGEIFCRLNTFSNDHLIRIIERHGGQVWLSDVAEWVWYTNDEQVLNLSREGKSISFGMLGCKIRHTVMRRDEHRLLAPFHKDLKGWEEPGHIRQILDLSRPYLPREGSHGEMVLSVGKALWYHQKGAAGVIDISPFTCMNGIICETVYPRVTRDKNGFPIRIFYFDGLQADMDGDIEIFLELARYYQQNNKGKGNG
jgi:predicted nucleotide-binding protein (sugar kinase/HSP70/actin superfamily)